MPSSFSGPAIVALLVAQTVQALPWYHTKPSHQVPAQDYYISLGPRPFYIVNNMTESPLKKKLQSCENGPFKITDFSIGHRGGATLQIPEESVENAMAGARFGAGVLECDVSLTADKGLVCRHSLCDLHTTTNILLNETLAAKCSIPFTPANATSDASALCCTTDITTAEYLSLCAKMDGFNASATSVADYQHGAPTWRTELYDTCGTVQTLDSYIDLVDSLPGYRNFTPELKSGSYDPTAASYGTFPANYTQEDYARDFVQAFIHKKIDPQRVWVQSFNPADIFLWIKEFPAFGRQAVYLDESGDTPETYVAAVALLPSLKTKGVNIIAPPFNYLLTAGGPQNQSIVPSSYAIAATAAGLDIITWSFERSGPLTEVKATGEYYYSSFADAVHTDGQFYEVLDILVKDVGIKAMFSDWSATVTYYANCFGLEGPKSEDYI
ncbi:glycerophosphoryl diester phosphodiesterase [Amniculicola lignicola CBS 123094]|uniref:glycerophosphodiester phosphodiesterase n=1 Tax=Amniculicola lignicola CBS 123094 TaxID=1392246 RepID=A0A6A5WFB5_9PLEO|nr:glycerophosphoryl diester phosphodiesterase [Amniculicola lignicola CBS 123094]